MEEDTDVVMYFRRLVSLEERSTGGINSRIDALITLITGEEVSSSDDDYDLY
jgi:hypothetical protein